MIAIVVSEADSASEHVGEHLLELAEWDRRADDARPAADGGGSYRVAEGFELRTFEELHLHLEGVADAFEADPELLVFASRHSGETGELLTAHFTGNFGAAEFGGEAGRLAEACPNALAAVVAALDDHAPERYEVGTECTHHGPSAVGCPSMFVEVGSAEPQWEDPEAARAVARAILDLRGVAAHRERQVLGVGGGHYAPRFSRILRETDWTVGHVAADWALSDLDPASEDARAVIDRAFERSRADRAVFDGEYPELAAAVEDLGHEVVSETWLREVGDRPLALVEAVEDELGPVEDGVRFGDATPGGDPEDDGRAFAVVEFPADLLAEAQGIDPEATRAAVEANAVAFGTREGGTRAEGTAAVGSGADYHALVGDLVEVLASDYDEVTREDGAVVATETAFDPELAAEAGVPEGPAFGKLAGGQAVEADGREVRPEEVHRERTRRFPVDPDPTGE